MYTNHLSFIFIDLKLWGAGELYDTTYKRLIMFFFIKRLFEYSKSISNIYLFSIDYDLLINELQWYTHNQKYSINEKQIGGIDDDIKESEI